MRRLLEAFRVRPWASRGNETAQLVCAYQAAWRKHLQGEVLTPGESQLVVELRSYPEAFREDVLLMSAGGLA